MASHEQFLDDYEISEMNIDINGIHVPYRVNDSHVIVICHCDMSLLFQ